MLTGLLSPDTGELMISISVITVSTGDATFYGVSIKDNLDVIRSMLGVCPQVRPTISDCHVTVM